MVIIMSTMKEHAPELFCMAVKICNGGFLKILLLVTKPIVQKSICVHCTWSSFEAIQACVIVMTNAYLWYCTG